MDSLATRQVACATIASLQFPWSRRAMFVVKHIRLLGTPVELVDGVGAPVPPVRDFLAHLAARGCSPHTAKAYAYDLRHLFAFLHAEAIDWTALTPARAVAFLVHLRTMPTRGRHAVRATQAADTHLAPTSVNRVLACVSSFYDWALLAGCTSGTNPIVKVEARSVLRSVDRHRPFLQGIASGAPLRRALARQDGASGAAAAVGRAGGPAASRAALPPRRRACPPHA